jgi:hypothetical protein
MLIRRVAAVAIVLCGCGRLGFASHAATADADAAPPADADAASSADADAAPTDSAWDAGADAASPVAREVIVAVQGIYGSYLVSLRWRPGSGAPADLGETPLRLDTLGDHGIRSVTLLEDGTLLVGSGYTPTGVFVSTDPLSERMPMQLVGGPLTNAHGLCGLPGGNVVVGEYSMNDGNEVAEYAPGADGDLTFVRSVYTTTVTKGSLTECRAVSDTEIYAADADTTTEVDGDVLRLVLVDGGWTEVARFDLSSFATDVYGVHDTPLWAFALLGGELYVFPSQRHTTRIPNLIRCTLPDLTECQELGALPPDDVLTVDDPDTIQGADAVPGTRQLLFSTHRAVYRYDLETDLYQEIYDLAGSLSFVGPGGEDDSVRKVRQVVVL